jgi:hypothetical protein
MARERVGLERTILCATRFWGGGEYDASGSGWNKTKWKRGATPPTLAKGVKNVVRKQGFATASIDKAIKKLAKGGFLDIGPGHQGYGAKTKSISTLALTAKGGKVGCGTVKLAPWTNDEYPGSRLQGVRPKKRAKRKSSLGCGCGG